MSWYISIKNLHGQFKKLTLQHLMLFFFSLLLHVFLYAVDCFKLKKTNFQNLGNF